MVPRAVSSFLHGTAVFDSHGNMVSARGIIIQYNIFWVFRWGDKSNIVVSGDKCGIGSELYRGLLFGL